jgi:hypothetical protein
MIACASNNAKTANVTVLVPTHKNLYDLNGDGIVDMKDIGIVAKAFGTSEAILDRTH